MEGEGFEPNPEVWAAQRLGAELRSHDESMTSRIPTEVPKHFKAPTVGVSSSELIV